MKNISHKSLRATRVLGLLAAITFRGSAQPAMQIQPSPHPSVSVQAFDRNRFPSFLPAIAGVSASLDPVFVVLTNNADIDILALTTVWITEDSQGRRQKIASRCDASVRHSGPASVVAAGQRMLLAPNLFLSESVAAQNTTGLAGGPDGRLIGQFLDRSRGSASTLLVLDAIIFADGSLYGPDVLRLGVDIPARLAAAKAVASAARQAMPTGADLGAAMQRFIAASASSAAGPNYQARWVKEFTRKLIAARNRSAYVSYLEGLPVPPVIVRKTP